MPDLTTGEYEILASLAVEVEPLAWTGLFNGLCPWPALDLFVAAHRLREAGLVVASGTSPVRYSITDAGRAALAASQPALSDGPS